MPELPEVETVRDGLARHLVGRTIVGVEHLAPRAMRRQAGGAAEFVDSLIGATPRAVVRRGKFAWVIFDDVSLALVVHLGMSGQMLVRDPESIAGVPHRHLRARLRLQDGGGVDFVDQRTFGYLLVSPLVATADGAPGGYGDPAHLIPAPVAHIARDLLDPALDRKALVAALRGKRTAIKRALLDQGVVSGVGNIYADEGLWRARVHPETPTDSLSVARLTRVLDGAAEVMREALEQGGTSFDELYVNVNGASGVLRPVARRLRSAGAAMPSVRNVNSPGLLR